MFIPAYPSESTRRTEMTGSLEDGLSSAAARGNTEEVELLLQSGAQVHGLNSFGRTALQVMMMGSSSVAGLLLERGADPNVADPHTGATPLHDAARTGFLDTVELLVHYKADPLAQDYAKKLPVDVASEQGHTAVVTFLQSLGKGLLGFSSSSSSVVQSEAF